MKETETTGFNTEDVYMRRDLEGMIESFYNLNMAIDTYDILRDIENRDGFYEDIKQIALDLGLKM